ncbi:hypothetical protein [Pedobacter sp. L105]|uniref:hypothetical protein n=1 Tax=Pedobacter sp. L105 TaxID=1641871 RepID=UPI00131DC7BF|nr:hypothetical protein [Pedobacter sp. L105]
MNKRRNVFDFHLYVIKNISLIIFFLTTCYLRGMAQVPTPGAALPFPNLPSANATALGTYGNYPISYTNGTPNISIPLYEIKTSRMSLPLSLSYHANGIKVHEQATSVGLGWTLNAGGAITRQINDLPDFDYNGYKHKVVVQGAHASPPIGSSPANLDPMNDEQRYYYGRLSMAPSQSGLQKFDGQPDDFFFNFGGKSGKFILKNTVDSAIAASFSTIPYTPIKIQYMESFSNGGDSFTIHDSDGTAYVFGRSVKDNSTATETSYTQTTSYNNYIDPTGHLVTSSSPSQTGTNVTAWFLTEMISSDLTDTISFKYASQYNATNTLAYQGKITNMFHPLSVGGGVSNQSTSSNSLSNVTTNNINLSEIDFKNGKVLFEYASRIDRGTYKLSRIRIYQAKGGAFKEIKRLNMNQSYFTSTTTASQIVVNSSDNTINSRLRLDGISEEGINADGSSLINPPYVINYNTLGNTGQIAYLGEYGQDLWGYWNGKSNTDLIISNPIGTASSRVPDSTYMIAGSIKSIKYPTGGITEFQFEPNRATRNYTTSDSTFQSYHLSTIGLYNSTSTDQTFTANQTIKASLQLSITSGCTSNCLQNMAQVYINDVTSGGTGSQVAFLGFAGTPPMPYSGTLSVNLVAGHIYRFYFPSPGNGTSQPRYHMEATLLHAGLTSVTSTPHADLVLTGGLRIKQVINYGSDNGVLTARRYNYKLPYYISDVFNGDFSDVGKGYTFLKYQRSPGSWQSDYSPSLLPYLQTYTENFTVSMAGATDGSVAYQEVEEYQVDQSGNLLGKTVYDFNKSQDAAVDNFSYVRINNSWRRNQLLEQKTYKSSGSDFILIKDVKNTYADLFPTQQDSTACFTVHRLFDQGDFRPTSGNQPIYDDNGGQFDGTINGPEVWNFNTYYVSLISQVNYRNALSSTQTTDYDLNGANPVSTQTDYVYDNPNHLMVTRKELSKSNLDIAIQRITYSTDYSLDGCNPNTPLTNLKATLTSLKSTFDAQSLPVYNQWITYVFRRWNINGGCLTPNHSGSTSYNQCLIDNNYHGYDQNIIDLYNQYGAIKSSYRTSVRQAVSDYNQALSSYVSCYNSQLSSSVDSVKALMMMQQNNQILPIEVDGTLRDHNSGVEYMASVSKSVYKTSGNTTQIGKTMLGIFNTNLPYTTYVGAPNSYLRGDMNYDSYNSSGNLLSYHQTSGPQGGFIWGYNQQYPIAEVKNATAGQVAYTGFEEGSASSGNWNYTSTGVNTTSLSPGLGIHEGMALYGIGSGAVTCNVTAGTYVVSYWASGALTVNGGAPALLGNSDSHGLRYFEHQVTMSNQGTISVNGTSGLVLDELRLYPAGAQMTSYTYDPLIGITSSSDPKSEISYFEYDGLQRLMNVRNKDGNIIKRTNYHFQGQ